MRIVVTYVVPPENEHQVSAMWDTIQPSHLLAIASEHFDQIIELKGKPREQCTHE